MQKPGLMRVRINRQRLRALQSSRGRLRQGLVIVAVAAIGSTTLLIARAATPVGSVEAENGQLANGASVVNDPAASGGEAVQFRSGSSGGTSGGGIITAGNSKANCLALPGGALGEVSPTNLNAAESVTGMTYNCLETFANPVDNWTDWESPWQFSNDPSTTDTTSSYETWAAWLKTGHQMILGVDLVPQNAPGVDTGNSNQANPLEWEQACAAGNYNQYATQLAQNLKGWGAGSIVIRLGIEANGGWEADYVGSTSAEGSNWGKCYSNEVAAMKAVDPGLLFVWNPNACQTDPQTVSGSSTMLTSLSEWYPGNSSVDIIAADDYDTDCTNSKLVSQEGWSAYASAQNGGGTSLSQIAAFAASNGKPLALPEWGLQSTGDDDAAYVNGVVSLISSSSNFSFNSYFDTNDDGIAPLGSTIPSATAAYISAFK